MPVRRFLVELTRHSGHRQGATITPVESAEYPTAAAAVHAAHDIARQHGITVGWRAHDDLNGQYLLLPDGLAIHWSEVRQ